MMLLLLLLLGRALTVQVRAVGRAALCAVVAHFPPAAVGALSSSPFPSACVCARARLCVQAQEGAGAGAIEALEQRLAALEATCAANAAGGWALHSTPLSLSLSRSLARSLSLSRARSRSLARSRARSVCV